VVGTVEANQHQTWASFEAIGPGIFLYHNVLSKDLNIVNTIENYLASNNDGNKWLQALVGFEQTMLDYRDCFDFKWKPSLFGNKKLDANESSLVSMYDAAYEKQNEAVKHYCAIFNIGELQYWESTNFVKYGPGQHFAHHVDHGFSYNCTVSLVGWPNDDYEGGELEFGMWGIKLKPQAGDLVIFPSNYMYPHRSLPVVSGTKYSLVTMLDYSDKYHTEEFRSYFYNGNKAPTASSNKKLDQFGIPRS
jgi:hypothetical protein